MGTIQLCNVGKEHFVETLRIELGDVQFPFYICANCDAAIVEGLLALKADRFLVIADDRVAELYGAGLVKRLQIRGACAELFHHKQGEGAKQLSVVEDLATAVLAAGATRQSLVIALGGGVTGNMAGMVAGLLFRGIRLAHVPTTMVAMMDSVISLKQAVNAGSAKNVLGLYRPAEAVFADVAVLASLPLKHIRSGMCELVKNALAICPEQIAGIEKLSSMESLARNTATLLELLRQSIASKMRVMASDQHEIFDGLVLEYGHTFGHAIELEAGGHLSHGESVGLGMLVAARISADTGGLDAASVALHIGLLEGLGAPVCLPPDVDPDRVWSRVLQDNKRGYLPTGSGGIAMIILERLGVPRRTGNRPLTRVEEATARSALQEIC